MSETEALKAELAYWQRVIGDRYGADDRRFSDMVRDLKEVLSGAPPAPAAGSEAYIDSLQRLHGITSKYGCLAGQDIFEFLEQRLAAPVQQSAASTAEPVAWQFKCLNGSWRQSDTPHADDIKIYGADRFRPLYAAPTTSPEPDAVREALEQVLQAYVAEQIANFEKSEKDEALSDHGRQAVLMRIVSYQMGANDVMARAFRALATLSRPAHGGWRSVPPEITDDMRYATWKAQALHVGATELEAIQMANRRMTPEQRAMDQAAYAAMLGAIPRNDRGSPER